MDEIVIDINLEIIDTQIKDLKDIILTKILMDNSTQEQKDAYVNLLRQKEDLLKAKFEFLKTREVKEDE